MTEPAPRTIIQLDRHHAILYGAVALLVFLGLVIFYESRFSTAKLEAKIAAKEQIVAAAEARTQERELEYRQRFADLEKLKSTPQTTPKQIIERIPTLMQWPTPPRVEPTPVPITGQLPTNPIQNLILDPANQRALNDRLVVCKECELERDTLKLNLVDSALTIKTRTEERDLAIKEAHKHHFGRTAKVLAIGGAIVYVCAKIFHF